MKELKLSGKSGIGKFALIDDEDYDRLSEFNWYFHPTGYTYSIIKINGIPTTVLMHRYINNTPSGLDTDHINGNRLDNRKENLRSCSHSDNCKNRPISKNNKSGFKGVSVFNVKYKGKCMPYIRAKIRVSGKSIHLGNFETLELASKAYEEASKKYFGEFARPSNP